MPDLIIENGWMCQTNEFWETRVTGSKGAEYHVTFGYTPFGPHEYVYECTCAHFKRRHLECKHIMVAKVDRCGWHSQFHAGEVDPQNPACPKCGGPVVAIRFAV